MLLSVRLIAIYVLLPVFVLLIINNPFWGIPFLLVYHSWAPELWGAPGFVRPEFIITSTTLLFMFIKSEVRLRATVNGILISFLLLSLSMIYFANNAVVSAEVAVQHGIKFTKVVILLFIFGNLIKSLHHVKLFYWYLIAGLFWLSKSILWQYFVEGRSRANPLGGGGGGGNAIATELCMTMPFLLVMSFTGKGWEKKCGIFFTLLWLVDLVAIASRGAFLTLLIVLLLFIYYFQYARKALPWLLGVTIAGGLFIPTFFWDRMLTIVDYKQDASAMSRFDLWDAGIKMFQLRPLFGVGAQNFQLLVKGYSDSERIPKEGLVAHNNFIQILAENGIVGFALYVAGLFFAFKYIKRIKTIYRHHNDEDGLAICIALEIAIISFLFRGMTGTNYTNEIVFYFMGALVGMYTSVIGQTENVKANSSEYYEGTLGRAK